MFTRSRLNSFFEPALAALVAAMLVFMGTINAAQAQAPPNFVSAAFYGGVGDQRGFGIAVDPGGIYLSGNDTTNGQSLGLEFALPPGPTPLWAASWPSVTSSTTEYFFGVTTTEEGAYFAGDSYSQTTDNVGDKEPKSVLVKFSLDGPTGSDVGGADWIAKPLFFPYSGYEGFNATTSTVEAGISYIYASGFGQQNFSNGTTVLAKYDTSGDNQWIQVLGNTAPNDYSTANSVTSLNGNLYVAGYSGGPTALTQAATLWKCDAAGNLIWTRTYQPSGTGAVATGVATYGNAIYVAGYLSPGPAGGIDALILKYDENGNLLWSQTWGGSADDLAYGIAIDGAQVYVVGETASFGAGGRDAFLLGISGATGAVLSSTYYGGAQDDIAHGVAVSGSDIYIVGESRSFASTSGNQVGQDDLMLLHYNLISLSSLQISPASTIGSQSTTGKVTLTAPAAVATVVTLNNTNSAATVPPTVTVPAGSSTATFTITTQAVAAKTTGNVTASYGGTHKSAKLTVNPIGLHSLTIVPNSLISGDNAIGVVTLQFPAAPGGITVTLSSSNPAVANPTVSSFTIPAGTYSAAFDITTGSVTTPTAVTITATANGITKSAKLKVVP